MPVMPMPVGCEFRKCYKRTAGCEGAFSVTCPSRAMCRAAAPPSGRAERLGRTRKAGR